MNVGAIMVGFIKVLVIAGVMIALAFVWHMLFEMCVRFLTICCKKCGISGDVTTMIINSSCVVSALMFIAILHLITAHNLFSWISR